MLKKRHPFIDIPCAPAVVTQATNLVFDAAP
jgi:hypothetical protein